MNVNEETAALIAEARRWANGHPNRRVSELIHGLVDALEAATRVPVQGEPNDDREALSLWRVMYVDESRDCDGFYPLGPFYVLASHEDDAWNAAGEIPKIDWPPYTGVYEARHATADEAAEWLASRATVPDAATEELLKRVEEAEAQSAEDRVEWQQMKERASQRFNAYQQKKRELRQMEIRAEKAEAERAAALAAIERVRALAYQHRSVEQHNEMVPVTDIADLIREPSSADYLAALDGAPEPDAAEKKYAIEYSSKTRTSIHEQESLESARVELARIPHPNGRIMQQVVAPWLPVEGEKP